MTTSQLRGYLLEEALAYLIRSAGYRIITASEDTPSRFRTRGNGLQIRGRGGWHQADVLGRLEIIPAFTYPMRLFIEAKYRTQPIGVDTVRNAIGTVVDLNSAGLSSDREELIPNNYRYEYALFSATGFNQEAAELAYAHSISLIDLDTPEYQPLLDAITIAATQISRYKDKHLLRVVRAILRSQLETANFDLTSREVFDNHYPHYVDIHESLATLAGTIRTYDKLYIGTVNAPFMLLLHADNPEQFESYSIQHGDQDQLVEIHWTMDDRSGGKWTIYPERDPQAYKLSFKLPELLRQRIFSKEVERNRRARDAKRRYLSEVCVYLRGKSIDRVIKLKLSDEFLKSLATA